MPRRSYGPLIHSESTSGGACPDWPRRVFLVTGDARDIVDRLAERKSLFLGGRKRRQHRLSVTDSDIARPRDDPHQRVSRRGAYA